MFCVSCHFGNVYLAMCSIDVYTCVCVCLSVSRPDTLDPALLRPGRLDRKVEFGLPDLEVRKERMIRNSCYQLLESGRLAGHIASFLYKEVSFSHLCLTQSYLSMWVCGEAWLITLGRDDRHLRTSRGLWAQVEWWYNLLNRKFAPIDQDNRVRQFPEVCIFSHGCTLLRGLQQLLVFWLSCSGQLVRLSSPSPILTSCVDTS